MAITTKSITSVWQAITTAGQSGSAWCVEFLDLAGNADQADVIVYHTTGAAPVNDEKITESKRLFKPIKNDDVMLLSADNASDVFYARCRTSGATAKINVDVV